MHDEKSDLVEGGVVNEVMFSRLTCFISIVLFYCLLRYQDDFWLIDHHFGNII